METSAIKVNDGSGIRTVDLSAMEDDWSIWLSLVDEWQRYVIILRSRFCNCVQRWQEVWYHGVQVNSTTGDAVLKKTTSFQSSKVYTKSLLRCIVPVIISLPFVLEVCFYARARQSNVSKTNAGLPVPATNCRAGNLLSNPNCSHWSIYHHESLNVIRSNQLSAGFRDASE